MGWKEIQSGAGAVELTRAGTVGHGGGVPATPRRGDGSRWPSGLSPAPPAPNGYAYPYAAQPPATYFKVATDNPPYPNQQSANFLSRVFTVFIGCIIIIGTIVFIIWLVLRPKVPQFSVDTLSLTNFNITSNSVISGNWNAGVTVCNPNSKITLYYDHVKAAMFYKSESIAMTMLPPFVQGKKVRISEIFGYPNLNTPRKKNETMVRATFASTSEYFDDPNEINSDRARGTVDFNLRMVARVRFKAGVWWTRRRILRIYCPDLSVGISANNSAGSMTGGSKHCRVGL
ncbi:hypothetical protein R6Q57_020618 [Mikania cordata]